jgi:hypothetical protein
MPWLLVLLLHLTNGVLLLLLLLLLLSRRRRERRRIHSGMRNVIHRAYTMFRRCPRKRTALNLLLFGKTPIICFSGSAKIRKLLP